MSLDKDEEIELKLRLLEPQIYEKILQDPVIDNLKKDSELRIKEYDTIYYDTNEHLLLKNELCYRIRRNADSYTVTIKGNGSSQNGLAIRNEWNMKIEKDIPTIGYFSDSAIGAELNRIVGEKSLIPIFKTTFKRFTYDLNFEDGSVVELAVDIGEIISGNKSEPINELELELKTGHVDNVLELGKVLLERYPLSTEDRSKYIRGLMLAGII